MGSDRLSRIERLLGEALDLPADRRSEFLDRACGDDAGLRAEIDSLLTAHDRAGEFMERPLVRHGVDLSDVSRESARSERVGNYKLLRRIGEGGMSEVYLAVRADDEYRKRVALKVIRHDLDREDMLRRFRTERQILAGLDHPNIAKLLDGGTTDDGLPYFVMDYIDGIPIDEYCDANRLPVGKRLELFRTVCAAVHYAHQNLVIHRDIKASNILVTSDGVPRLLDFGIAKLLKPDQFAQQVEYTETWMRPMTPRYASPEQLEGKSVTTASDVYSLGVLLYKMLTSHLPYRLEGQPASQLARLVVEEEPERPSTSIDRVESGALHGSTTDVTAETVSKLRDVQPSQLRRQLAGDLDNILLMALRKEPQRRYTSVERFSEDIRRHMTGLPVLARKDTLGYRTTKFLRRNWLAVGVAAAFALLLVGFAVTMAVQAGRIARQRDEARRARDRSDRVVRFMEDIFEVSDPVEGEGEHVTAREILDRGAERVARELGDEPLIQATLSQTIGSVYRNLGLYDQARPLLEQSLETRRRIHGAPHLEVAESLMGLGILARLEGEYDPAEAFLRQSIEMRRELLDEDDQSIVESLNHLGIVLRKTGDYDEAKQLYRMSIAIQEKTLGEHPELASGKNNLAALLLQMGDPQGAEQLFRESLKLRRKLLGSRHALTVQSLGNLGATLGMQGKYDEADPYLREALAMYREILDPGHPALIEALNNLAKLSQRMGDSEAAEALYREAIEIDWQRLGEDHPKKAHLAANLAELLQERGDYAEAEAFARQALEIRRRAFGEEHADVGSSLIRLGSLLMDRGRPSEAEPLMRRGLEITRATLPENHWREASAANWLGNCLGANGRFEEGEPLVVQGYERLRDSRGADHAHTRAALARVVDFYESWGRADEAARYRDLLLE